VIEFYGDTNGSEYEAAMAIKQSLLLAFPDLQRNKNDIVKFFVGAKIYGEKREDIDIILAANFSTPRVYDVELVHHPHQGRDFTPRKAEVSNFLLNIEVKDHDQRLVKFEGANAIVKYTNPERSENATNQAREQMFSLKSFLRKKNMRNIYIQDLLFFTNLNEEDLPERPHNCFGYATTFHKILNIIGQVATHSVHAQENREVQISFSKREDFDELFSEDGSIFCKVEPTNIDRRKMDRIATDNVNKEWLEDFQKKQVTFRGKGGVGKTIILLQLAYRSFDQRQLRSLMLTYNNTLVADMKRTMALLGVPKSIHEGGIEIGTVHSFFLKLFIEFDILDSPGNFDINKFEKYKNEFLELLSGGAINDSDIEKYKKKNPEDLQWDLIFIDEGQDWPENEIKIIRSLYSPSSMVIADGVDQFVRSPSVADWIKGISSEKRKVRTLRRCLRMKANLAKFIIDFEKYFNVDDDTIQPNDDATGGRVIIIEGDLCNNYPRFQEVIESARKDGNRPIDCLGIVPPSLVVNTNQGRISKPSLMLNKNNQSTWDATSTTVRKDFTRNNDDFRIVTYDSCRGLEGWAVINYAFQDFWKYKHDKIKDETRDLFGQEPEEVLRLTLNWVKIPLTRAIDTLIINITEPDEVIHPALKHIHENRDFVEWINLSNN